MATPRNGRSSHCYCCDHSGTFHRAPTHPWVSLREDVYGTTSPDEEDAEDDYVDDDDDVEHDDCYESFPTRGDSSNRFSEVARSPESTVEVYGGNGNGNSGFAMPSLERVVEVRIVSHVDRVDLGGNRYTAYVVRVRGPPVCEPLHSPQSTGSRDRDNGNDYTTPRGGALQVERRYSDFRKLRERLKAHYWEDDPARGDSDDGFPPRNWAGSRYLWSLASEAHRRDVADHRLVQLDGWLEQVLQDCRAAGPLSRTAPRAAIRDFLFAHFAPCDQLPSALQEEEELPRPPSRSVATPSPRRRSLASIGGAAARYHNPWTATLGSAVRQAVGTLRDLTAHADASIPCDLLRAAQGLLFLTVAKGGLVVSGRVGSGLVVARQVDRRGRRAGWSAPCAVAVAGLGWGALAGGDVTHFLVVFTSRKATRDLVSSAVRLQLGAELGIAVGPLGRGANSQVHRGGWSVHAAYAYATSHGLFAGASLEGSVLRVRDEVNAVFYGRQVAATDLLQQPEVAAAGPLYRALGRAEQVDIPDGAFRPSQYFA